MGLFTDETTSIEFALRRSGVPTAADIAGRPWLIDFSFFEMPVRIRVRGIDLLESPLSVPGNLDLGDHIRRTHPAPSGRAWLVTPVVHMADMGLRALVDARRKGSSQLFVGHGGRRLIFRRSGGELAVFSEFNSLEASEDFHALYMAMDRFADEVREILLAAAPELRSHYYWGRWTDGERFPPRSGLTAPDAPVFY